MSELPKGWSLVSLEKIADWGSGGTPKRNESSYYGGDIPWVKTGDLGPKYLCHSSEFISQEGLKNSSAKLFSKGSVAIAMYGATIGKTSILDFDASTNQACAVGMPIVGVTDTNFLYYLLNNEKQDFIKKGKGGAQPNISQQIIKAHEIWFPPFAEQKRIVEKLDQVLAQVDTIKARLDGIPAILKRFRQSVLAAAVSGKLTEELQGNWEIQTLSSLCISVSDGDHQAPPKSTDGIPFLVISNVNKKNVDLQSATRMVPRSYYDSLKPIRKPELNDILYTVTGSFGIPVIVDTNEPFCFQRHIAIIKPNHEVVHFKYLAYFLESPQVFRRAEELATGTAQKTLSLNSLRNFQISLPDFEEQTEIVRLVDQYFAFADTIEKQVQKAQQRVDKLTQSILAKAFRGELVPQDPSDEPADQLLKRIAAARAESEALAKAAKKTTKIVSKKG